MGCIMKKLILVITFALFSSTVRATTIPVLYGTEIDNDTLFTINLTSGEVTSVGSSTTFVDDTAVAWYGEHIQWSRGHRPKVQLQPCMVCTRRTMIC